MMLGEDVVPALVTLSEAQDFLRIDSGEDEAAIAGLIRTATALCEQFVGDAILLRSFREVLPATGEWQKLRRRPVRSISALYGVDASGTAVPLNSAEYLADIDADGRGWVRCSAGLGRPQVEVRGTVGMAADVNQVPEPLRHGVLRLVGHLHANRDGPGGEPPAAVTALWRPYRRLALR